MTDCDRSILARLRALDARPALYAPGGSDIWTDEHLAKGMLAAHLSDETDAASFQPQTRAALLAFLDGACPARAFPRVLDLGCGPGLYALAMARGGRDVTGVDISPGSIAHAREAARAVGQPVRYLCADYTTPAFWREAGQGFDLAVMISCDYGALPPEGRAALLRGAFAALRPGGVLLLDALTTRHPIDPEGSGTWETGHGGYWSAGGYLLLNRCWRYERHISCRRHIVVDARGVSDFNVWEHLFAPEEIAGEVTQAGFDAPALYGDYSGAPYEKDGGMVMVVARRAPLQKM